MFFIYLTKRRNFLCKIIFHLWGLICEDNLSQEGSSLSIDIVAGTNDGGSFDLSQVNHVLTKLYAISYFGTILDAQDIKFSIHSKGTYTRTNYSHPRVCLGKYTYILFENFTTTWWCPYFYHCSSHLKNAIT